MRTALISIMFRQIFCGESAIDEFEQLEIDV
jgi:hypothetical protein